MQTNSAVQVATPVPTVPTGAGSYRCALAPEKKSAKLEFPGGRLSVQVLETSADGFLIAIDHFECEQFEDADWLRLHHDECIFETRIDQIDLADDHAEIWLRLIADATPPEEFWVFNIRRKLRRWFSKLSRKTVISLSLLGILFAGLLLYFVTRPGGSAKESEMRYNKFLRQQSDEEQPEDPAIPSDPK